MSVFRFFYHYNKPLSRSQGKPMISLHYKNQCHFIDGAKFKIKVDTESKVNKRQPNLVIQGWCEEIVECNGHTIVK